MSHQEDGPWRLCALDRVFAQDLNWASTGSAKPLGPFKSFLVWFRNSANREGSCSPFLPPPASNAKSKPAVAGLWTRWAGLWDRLGGRGLSLAPPPSGREGEVPPASPKAAPPPSCPTTEAGGLAGLRAWLGAAMPLSLSSHLFLDLVLCVAGTLSFLLNVIADTWAVVQYVRSGSYLWAALVLALLGLASVLLQLFSWVWLTSDPAELHGSLPSRRFLALLHLLQLGYLYRFLQGLQQGLSMLRQELPTESDLAYADFLSLDISMLRLFESFLEATPQLTLVLAIILQSGNSEYYQWFGISTSFLGISWALMDYHRSLRTCLPCKPRLGWSSSAIYFLWNLLLLWPRIFAVALFSALFPYYIALHFLSLWLVLLFWVWLQDTKFMPNSTTEWLYRVTVAIILYFSWFNVAGGRTLGRSTIHLIFIISDSTLLVSTWATHNISLPNGTFLPLCLTFGGTCFLLGLTLRLMYYLWLHPHCRWEPDQVDGARSLLPVIKPKRLYNRRATQLAQNFFPKDKKKSTLPEQVGEVEGVF
ncbi:XK-related protein 8 [Cricetulus griseus]|uniref:XK-related protein n=3 Tax=Cricetulus griseus TaxID=10029 RepID=A0A9J7J8N4_CRIGR|nr:XK-related protein 8 [Cricetulus griseus]